MTPIRPRLAFTLALPLANEDLEHDVPAGAREVGIGERARAQACDVAPRSRQRQDRFQQLLFGEHAALGRGQCQFVRP